MSTEPQPTPKPEKPRVLQDGRDMFWSLAPLVVACIVLAGLVGMCSFSPGGVRSGPAPDYDAAAALRADAMHLGFPVRLPAVPEDWHSNSGGRGDIDGGRTDPATGQPTRAVLSTVGYLTPTGRYMALTQSNADEEKLVGSIRPSLHPTGTVEVDGVDWVVYRDSETEPVWTTRIGGPGGTAQVAITGAGDEEEFRTFAAAVQSQDPLPWQH